MKVTQLSSLRSSVGTFNKISRRFFFNPSGLSCFGNEIDWEEMRYDFDSWEATRRSFIDGLVKRHRVGFIAVEFYKVVDRATFDSIIQPASCGGRYNDFSLADKLFREVIVNQLCLGFLNKLELAEFLYLIIDKEFMLNNLYTIELPDDRYRVKFRGFFVVRSITPFDYSGYLRACVEAFRSNEFFSSPDCYAHAYEIEDYYKKEAFWTDLFYSVNANPERGYERMARFHAWHWFRDYNSIFIPGVDAPYGGFFETTFKSYYTSGLVPFNYYSHNPYKEKGDIGCSPEISLLHRHHNVPSFVSTSRNVWVEWWLHLFNIYWQLNKMIIRKQNDELFLYQLSENRTVYSLLSSLRAFVANQFDSVLQKLRLEFPLSFRGQVFPYVLEHEQQVECIVALINTRPELLLKNIVGPS